MVVLSLSTNQIVHCYLVQENYIYLVTAKHTVCPAHLFIHVLPNINIATGALTLWFMLNTLR